MLATPLNLQKHTAANIGLLLWGRTEVNPGFTPLFSFGYGFDRLIFGFTFKIKIRFFNWVLQPGRTQQLFPHSSKPRTLGAMQEQLEE